jgi:hypothetical protein
MITSADDLRLLVYFRFGFFTDFFAVCFLSTKLSSRFNDMSESLLLLLLELSEELLELELEEDPELELLSESLSELLLEDEEELDEETKDDDVLDTEELLSVLLSVSLPSTLNEERSSDFVFDVLGLLI